MKLTDCTKKYNRSQLMTFNQNFPLESIIRKRVSIIRNIYVLCSLFIFNFLRYIQKTFDVFDE